MKYIFFFIFILITFSVNAKWEKVGENDITNNFVDLESKKRSGEFSILWLMFDYKFIEQVKGKSYISRKQKQQFDCENNFSRRLFFSLHSKFKGKGEEVYKDKTVEEWKPNINGSVIEKLSKIACN
tara:strand:+ start:509 stop:886 length:378 start_codon:yes stop_codon:yes gene_type:complete